MFGNEDTQFMNKIRNNLKRELGIDDSEGDNDEFMF
jgi:hypothetical protein